MACSRMPKWTWVPPGCPWDWISAPAPKSVPVLPVRSPAPTTRPGICPLVAVRHLLMALRVASLVPASKEGRLSAQPGSPRPRRQASKRSRSPIDTAWRFSQASRCGPAATGTFGVELWDLVRNVEVLVDGQAEERLGEAHLFSTEGLPVGLLGVGAMWRGPADVAAEHQQRRAVRFGHAPAQARLEGVQVVCHFAQDLDVPSIALEALDDVVGAREVGGPVDRDVVVVEDVNETAQPEVACERGGLVAHALHQVTVAADHEDVVIDRLRPEFRRAGSARRRPCRRRWRSPGPAAPS